MQIRIILIALFIPLVICSACMPKSKSIRQRRLQRSTLSQEFRPTPTIADNSNNLLQLPSNEDSALWYQVPQNLQQEVLPSNHHHITFYAFDDLFTNMHFSKIFNTNSDFRHKLRIAARLDFMFDENLKSHSSLLMNPRSTISGRWGPTSKCDYQKTTAVLNEYFPPSLDGPTFFDTIFSLCPQTKYRFNSWMDIIGIAGRKINHSWHQDSGRHQNTIMVGFPPTSQYEGIGVFSHAVKLSHRLIDPLAGHNEPRLLEDIIPSVQLSNDYIIRPTYIPGKSEIMVYDDRDIFHSAPDYAYRESIWRIM